MGDYNFVHLAWFYDDLIAKQVLTQLEITGMRTYNERGLGVTSVWVLESLEMDGLRILQSNPDWMAARVKGATGFQAKNDETPEAEPSNR